MPLLPVLTIVFVVLKLCNVIAWSWFWVLSPMILAVIIWIIAVTVIAVVTAKGGRF